MFFEKEITEYTPQSCEEIGKVFFDQYVINPDEAVVMLGNELMQIKIHDDYRQMLTADIVPWVIKCCVCSVINRGFDFYQFAIRLASNDFKLHKQIKLLVILDLMKFAIPGYYYDYMMKWPNFDNELRYGSGVVAYAMAIGLNLKNIRDWVDIERKMVEREREDNGYALGRKLSSRSSVYYKNWWFEDISLKEVWTRCPNMFDNPAVVLLISRFYQPCKKDIEELEVERNRSLNTKRKMKVFLSNYSDLARYGLVYPEDDRAIEDWVNFKPVKMILESL